MKNFESIKFQMTDTELLKQLLSRATDAVTQMQGNGRVTVHCDKGVTIFFKMADGPATVVDVEVDFDLKHHTEEEGILYLAYDLRLFSYLVKAWKEGSLVANKDSGVYKALRLIIEEFAV